jgi:hypothetical protein
MHRKNGCHQDFVDCFHVAVAKKHPLSNERNSLYIRGAHRFGPRMFFARQGDAFHISIRS